MDSNLQYAGAVNLVIAPFVAPGCLGRVGTPEGGVVQLFCHKP
jgi:hypothetical protein